MLKIGITGGIGSGKTTVCKFFELLGIPVYYADDASKELLRSNAAVKTHVLNVFGKSILDQHGAVDRKTLAAIVFNNKTELDKLNAIMHPAVALHFEDWIKKKAAPYILKEAAILFESGAYQKVDSVITVAAPLELKISRTIKRDGVPKEDILARIENQTSDDEKIKRSEFVIYNDEQQLLIPQVLRIHSQLVNK
jgi:dephospho-CoA kinase